MDLCFKFIIMASRWRRMCRLGDRYTEITGGLSIDDEVILSQGS